MLVSLAGRNELRPGKIGLLSLALLLLLGLRHAPAFAHDEVEWIMRDPAYGAACVFFRSSVCQAQRPLERTVRARRPIGDRDSDRTRIQVAAHQVVNGTWF